MERESALRKIRKHRREDHFMKRHYPLVEPRRGRYADSVEGPFYVAADECITCALPPETAPDCIQWDEDFRTAGCQGCPEHCRVVRQPETEPELELMLEAVHGSCVSAIRYCGTDAYTLARLRGMGCAHVCDVFPESGDVVSPELKSLIQTLWGRFRRDPKPGE